MCRKSIRLFLSLLVIITFLLPWGSARAFVDQTQEPPGETEEVSTPSAPEVLTARLSIPAAAFTPLQYQFDFENHGRYLKNFEAVSAEFRAAVHLPHGSTVTSVSACFNDDSPSLNGRVDLYSMPWIMGAQEMAVVQSSGSTGFGIFSDTSTANSSINNSTHTYYVRLTLPAAASVWGCGVFINYTPPVLFGSGVVSVPGAAFRPMADGYNFNHNQFQGMITHHSLPGNNTTSNGNYLASVELPNGATVTKMTLHYFEASPTKTIEAYLQRSSAEEPVTYYDMAHISSVDSGGGTYEQSDTTITDAAIDNQENIYWIYLGLPPSGSEGLYVEAVTLEYTITPSTGPGYLALSNAAFYGYHDEYQYENHARWLFHEVYEQGTPNTGVYLAPITLPDGVLITRFFAHYYHGINSGPGTVHLARSRQGSWEDMAAFTGIGNSVYTHQGSAVNYALVNNSQYVYYVWWELSPATPGASPDSDDMVPVSVQVEYSAPDLLYLPMTLRSGT